MSVAAKLVAIPVALLLGLVSVPWIFWAIGCAFVGDEPAAERAFEACPLYRYLGWIEAR